jgi:hypothetical protein
MIGLSSIRRGLGEAMGDFVRYFSEFDKSYRCMYLAMNEEFIENLALAMGIEHIPYAIMLGRGEIWACFDEAVTHPRVGYFRMDYTRHIH